MVYDISKRRRVMMFFEGLAEPLKGWVKSLDPGSLQEAMKKARNLEAFAPRGKFFSKPTTSSYDRTQPRREKMEGKRPAAAPLDRDTINDLRKLCFYCKGPYDVDHDCPMKPKGKNRMMEWFYDDDGSADLQEQSGDSNQDQHRSDDVDDEVDDSNLKVAYLSSTRKEGVFRMHGLIAGQGIVALFDIGATHNFIDARLVTRRGMQIEDFEGLQVQVADGYTLKCNKMITDLPVKHNTYTLSADFYVVDMGGTDIVLGMA